ncbi:ABC transporter ATP-binding protein [Ancylobacter sp. IITR112]|uniref:ABC transporter ATP-binding protein n=1 Tax=Ancylobacter sp. IITR112 TaxID=3138073 RepID=UPI003529ED72
MTESRTDRTLVQAGRELYRELSPALRRTLLPLLGLMLIGAFAELFNLGAVVVFLSIIAEPQSIARFPVLPGLLSAIGADTPAEWTYVVTGLFCLCVLFAAAIRLLLLKKTVSFGFDASCELGSRLFAMTLHQDYIYHTRQNSSEILAAVNKAQQITGEVLLPAMQAVVSLILALFIVAGLVWIDPRVAVTSGVALTAIYVGTSMVSRARLRRNSTIIARAQGMRFKVMQEGIGGIRDILLDRSQSVFTEAYDRAEADIRDARTTTALASMSPRHVVEALGIVVVAIVACVAALGAGGLTQILPVLGALALGAQRLLPLLQQIYSGWATTIGNRQVLFDLADLLQRPVPTVPSKAVSLTFEKALTIDRVGYRYAEGARPALVDVSLTIPRGARLGIAGKTGSGKSTLMDIIIGLLEPTQGEIRVDGVALTAANRHGWQRHIAHVPQAIFLSDASVAENIAFGVRPAEIDYAWVRRAAEQAELTEVIETLPKGYETRVGERGIQLSGGQRQRIGIARALYKQASVLVFDEATSALDNETEAAVMQAIERLDRQLTILIIAHRLSTLEGCDMVVRLEGGRVVVPEKAAP